MSLNLFGSNLESGYTGLNGSGLFDNKSRAILYLFKPFRNQFNDVAIRSYNYRIDDQNFIDKSREIVDLVKKGTGNENEMIGHLMRTTNLNDYMEASIIPTLQIKTNSLSDRWRFLLILSQDGSDLSISNTYLNSGGDNNVKRIYSGFIEGGEPYNQFGFSGKPQLNPECYLVITHKTKVGSMVHYQQFGPKQVVNTYSSEEFVHPELVTSLAVTNNSSAFNHGVFLMTPDNCVSALDQTENGTSIALPGANSNLRISNAVEQFDDFLQRPSDNISHIVSGLIKETDDNTHRSKIMNRSGASLFGEDYLDEAHRRVSFAKHLGLPKSSNLNPFDLKVNNRYSTSQIDDMVNGQLEIIEVGIDRPTYYETADHQIADSANQFASLIATITPTILNSIGLCEMTFVYQVARMQGQVRENFVTTHAAPVHAGLSPDAIRSMAKGVEAELRNGVFRTIFESKGAFEIAATVHTTGITSINLNLVDQGIRTYVPFEMPTCLGGLVSPLLGDMTANAHNSNQIESFFNENRGIVRQPFDDDNSLFMDDSSDMSHYLQSHFNRQDGYDDDGDDLDSVSSY